MREISEKWTLLVCFFYYYFLVLKHNWRNLEERKITIFCSNFVGKKIFRKTKVKKICWIAPQSEIKVNELNTILLLSDSFFKCKDAFLKTKKDQVSTKKNQRVVKLARKDQHSAFIERRLYPEWYCERWEKKPRKEAKREEKNWNNIFWRLFSSFFSKKKVHNYRTASCLSFARDLKSWKLRFSSARKTWTVCDCDFFRSFYF